jgi:NAD(P)-dependent dehydrogenase (short-subunit alcohol dehydrogenase family)
LITYFVTRRGVRRKRDMEVPPQASFNFPSIHLPCEASNTAMSSSPFTPHYLRSLLSRPSTLLPRPLTRYPDHSSPYSNSAKPRLTRVLITGGSRGIGFAIASAFTKAGSYEVLITGRNETPLLEATSALQQQYKSKHPDCTQAELETRFKGAKADISDPSTWNKAFSNKWPIPDILVNSAGISHSSLLMAMKTKHSLSDEDSDVEHIINTNLMGTIYACQSVSKEMLRAKRNDPSPQHSPCIINISSLLATHGGRGTSVYSASKAGVLGTNYCPTLPMSCTETTEQVSREHSLPNLDLVASESTP